MPLKFIASPLISIDVSLPIYKHHENTSELLQFTNEMCGMVILLQLQLQLESNP